MTFCHAVMSQRGHQVGSAEAGLSYCLPGGQPSTYRTSLRHPTQWAYERHRTPCESASNLVVPRPRSTAHGQASNQKKATSRWLVASPLKDVVGNRSGPGGPGRLVWANLSGCVTARVGFWGAVGFLNIPITGERPTDAPREKPGGRVKAGAGAPRSGRRRRVGRSR